MTNAPHDDDARFDALLRDLAPDIPQPELDAAARTRILASIDGAAPAPRAGRGGTWLLAASIVLVAALGVACAVLWADLDRERTRAAQAQWESDEVLQLLVAARMTQAPVPVADDLSGLHPDDLTLIAFHHDLCPISRISSPGFRTLAVEHAGDAVRFITFDLTGTRRDEAGAEIDDLDLRYALAGPLGAETGVVKVLDTTHHRVLSAGPGRLGLEQAERILALVAGR